MEDGEIQDENATISGSGYDPSLEWPGSGSDMPSTSGTTPHSFVDEEGPSVYAVTPKQPFHSASTSPTASLRLLVRQSSVLPKTQTLALLDGYSEVQIGRDAPSPGDSVPRLRLKEMEISKLHATIFWDQNRLEWAIVDMGSKHGTFYQPNHTVSKAHAASTPAAGTPSMPDGPGPSSWRIDARGTRLSPPRVASVPRTLSHGDTLSAGSTIFVVHIHGDGMPCTDCSPAGGDEISLFDHRDKKRKRAESEIATAFVQHSSTERDPKKAMSVLKRNLLSRHSSPALSNSKSAPSSYVDRSALRRSLHTDTPDPLAHRKITPTSNSPIPKPTPPPVSAPAAPLPSTNVGHRLLMKQGWQPGTGLGVSDTDTDRGSVALIEPLDVSGNQNRTGLGMVTPAPAAFGDDGANWREQAKMRRWASLKTARSDKK